ncbi:hypothetical protein RhiirA4_500955, partial [Rhizophagus irregularis]
KDKKKSDINIGKEKQEDILQRPINLFGRYEDLEGVKEYILFGKEILDFTVVVNRVGTAKNLVQDKNDGGPVVSSKKKEPDNIVTPLQTNINEPLEPKEASSRRELRKKKQQVSFNTNNQVLQNTSSPVFLVSSPKKVSTNTAGQSTDQNLDVNNDVSNKQTSSSAIGQTSDDHNNITSNDQIVNDQQVILPDIEMIMDEQDDDTNQFHKLENNKIVAILKVPINSPDNIDEYKKFMKIVQNSILEDSMLKQEDIISLQVQIITQKVPEGTVTQMNDSQKKVNKIITGISLQATLISQQTWKDLQETPYRCDGIDYFFEEIITNRTRQNKIMEIRKIGSYKCLMRHFV